MKEYKFLKDYVGNKLSKAKIFRNRNLEKTLYVSEVIIYHTKGTNTLSTF